MMKRTHTTVDIARLLDVNQKTVIDWIDRGRIKAYATPGGHRRVQAGDLLEFLRRHDIPVPDGLRREHPRILVVDDDSYTTKNIRAFLESQQEQYEVFTAADGFAAGEAVAQLRPDLVLLDIRLPGIDGIAVCERIKQKYPEIMVAAITGFPTPENKERMAKAGADAFLEKPFRMKAMLAVIESLLAVE